MEKQTKKGKTKQAKGKSTEQATAGDVSRYKNNTFVLVMCYMRSIMLERIRKVLNILYNNKGKELNRKNGKFVYKLTNKIFSI